MSVLLRSVLLSSLLLGAQGCAAAAQQASIHALQLSVTELPSSEAPPVRGWILTREVHVFREGGYCAVNMLYATHQQEKVPLYESARPVRFLASAGPYWVLWDTRVAHMGAMVFVVYVPAEGKPFVVFQSQQSESSVCLRDELLGSQYTAGLLQLRLLSTDVDTGKRYQREFTISVDAGGN